MQMELSLREKMFSIALVPVKRLIKSWPYMQPCGQYASVVAAFRQRN
jgi:hypothetical protein